MTELPQGSPTLQIADLHYEYPDGTSALRGVDLTIRSGERVAVLGPNGAGKTTLMLHLNGLLSPASGAVVIEGTPVTPDTAAEIRQRVGLVFQDPDDQLFMPTVQQDVAFGPANAGLHGEALESRVKRALREVDMLSSANRPPHHLSQGQRRRVAIATVLASEPDILILDEPSSNLDPTSRREVAEVLERLGRTTVMVTHDLSYALQLCERSVILSQGRIVADAPTVELLSNAPLLATHRLELPYGFDPTKLSA
ncbi:MAG: energy-coupling factor ABC transporter ATP-binding protein [Actinomycetia bacterium]|nr:energy-coupling factor ABC transporter ATP-binding protein [Actinomycetes bacterium]